MSRYIDVEPLIKSLEISGFKNESSYYSQGFDNAIATMIGVLQKIPTAKVAEVVTCEDCKYQDICLVKNLLSADLKYCSNGERSENGKQRI